MWLWCAFFWQKQKTHCANLLNARYHFQFTGATSVQCSISWHTDDCPGNLAWFHFMMLNRSGVKSVCHLQPAPTPTGSSSFRITSVSSFFLLLVKEPSWYHTFVSVPYATAFCVKSTASLKFFKSPMVFWSPSLPAQMVCSRCSSEMLKKWSIFNAHRHTSPHTHTHVYKSTYI